MSTEARAPRGEEWALAIEALHGLANALAVRAHYNEGHPAIARADRGAVATFARLFEALPELVLAILDGEVVVSERPMPELRARIETVIEAMSRHDVECVVFQRGMTAEDLSLLARMLAARTADGARLREAQAGLVHVLLRYAEIKVQEHDRRGSELRSFSTEARALLDAAARAIADGSAFDPALAIALARNIVDAAASRTFVLEQRCLAPGEADHATHAANVATMVAAMTVESRMPSAVCVDATAAALLHDVGKLVLPAAIRDVPEPLLDDAGRAVFRNHAFGGAWLLLGWGCPPLWVAAALEHHRGVDGGGYPALSTNAAPHDLVRIVALASFVDAKRTRLVGRDGACEADEALRAAGALAGRFFDGGELRAFERALGAFPPGATVELSNRLVGQVTQASPADPLRPQVELLIGPDARKRTDLRQLDAIEDRHVLSIVRAVAPPMLVSTAEIAVPVVAPPSPPRRLSGMYSSLQPVAIEEPPPVVITSPPAPATFSAPPKALVADATYRADLEQTLLERLGSLDRVPAVRVAPRDLAKLGIDHRAGFVLSMIDGMTPIEMLIDLSGLPRVDVLRILDELVQAGAVALE